MDTVCLCMGCGSALMWPHSQTTLHWSQGTSKVQRKSVEIDDPLGLITVAKGQAMLTSVFKKMAVMSLYCTSSIRCQSDAWV
eukprot:3274142-Amphidinium_carterae.1